MTARKTKQTLFSLDQKLPQFVIAVPGTELQYHFDTWELYHRLQANQKDIAEAHAALQQGERKLLVDLVQNITRIKVVDYTFSAFDAERFLVAFYEHFDTTAAPILKKTGFWQTSAAPTDSPQTKSTN
jgi:hypothetical protein